MAQKMRFGAVCTQIRTHRHTHESETASFKLQNAEIGFHVWLLKRQLRSAVICEETVDVFVDVFITSTTCCGGGAFRYLYSKVMRGWRHSCVIEG